MRKMIWLLIGLVLILILTSFYGYWRFNHTVEKEKEAFLNSQGKKEMKITIKDLDHLPHLMQEYLKKVGVLGKCRDCHIVFKQIGRIRSKPNQRWTHFNATQYMTAEPAGFLWSAQAFPIFIRDKSIEGKGEVKVSFMGLKNLAISSDPETDQSALARCLGEYLFYPVGFLNKEISWEVMDARQLKAKMTYKNTAVEGVFQFDDDGLLERFRTQRYREKTLTDFTGLAEEYKLIQGYYVPTRMRAIWNLPEGDFEYFNCTISDYRIE
ncbi:DUF6544 family protein [Poritiphilus flavus]|uniref:Outer membrane lipoprotein-sorting protein n=1 Tax=Poritiphilus flavus TaxID=2697053 RepID=A0A6L9EBH9_9FLAO|nr:DUF6544 family protein [Poritiphilus flavus]NAS11908.1 hypothetical protein [Poritiphilus flavus]